MDTGPEGTRNKGAEDCLGLSQFGPSTGMRLGVGLTPKSGATCGLA